MRLNADLTKPVLVHASHLDWLPSPAAGVDRRMLYRVGGEVARATSIVRYAPGSSFARHSHTGGEEILVLEGTFQDEHGDFPAGSYFRNPPGTSHVPAARDGCVIFVRLWQFRTGDLAQIVQPPGGGQPLMAAPGSRLLFDDGHERVTIVDVPAGDKIAVQNPRGLEFLVITGSMALGAEDCPPQSWGRMPAGSDLSAIAGPKGASLWIKDAALQHASVLQMPDQPS